MNVFLAALDEHDVELRKAQRVDVAMRSLVKWAERYRRAAEVRAAEGEHMIATDRAVRATPLVDTNSLLAIESLFGRGAVDPWATELACTFTDLFVYADWFRFTFGSPQGAPVALNWGKAPALAQRLQQRDSSAVVPLPITTEEPVTLHDDYLADAFRRFAVWARNNPKRLRRWLNTHDTASIRAMQLAQVSREYYFNLEQLTQMRELEMLAPELGAHQSEVLYAFDNVLRGPLYGKLAGADQHYLNHPARDVSLLPTFEAEPDSPTRIAVSFKNSMASALRHLSFEETRDSHLLWRHEIGDCP